MRVGHLIKYLLKINFKTIASKEIYVLLHLVLMFCLICVNTYWSYKSCLGQFDSRFISTPFIPAFFQGAIQYVPHLFHLLQSTKI